MINHILIGTIFGVVAAFIANSTQQRSGTRGEIPHVSSLDGGALGGSLAVRW